MAHIHDLIDFTIGAYIVHDDKVIFIHHNKLNRWLPIGGHIELDEDPDQALFREIEEETGLRRDQLEVLSNKPDYESSEQKFLYTPNLLDIHKINETHRHIGMLYFIRANSATLRLAPDEHSEIVWLSKQDLHNKKYELRDDIIYAAEKVIELAKSQQK